MTYLYAFCDLYHSYYPFAMSSHRKLLSKILLIYLFLLFPALDSTAQSSNNNVQADSLRFEVLEKNLDQLLKEQQNDKARHTVDSMFVLARESGNYKWIGDTYFNYGRVEKSKGNPSGLIDQVKTSISYYRRANAWKQAGKSYFIIAQTCIELKDDKSALDYFLESVQMREKALDSLGTANSLVNIAALTYKAGNYPAASDYFFRALTYAEKLKNDKLRAACLSNLSHLSNKMNNYGQSISYLNEALELQRKLGNRQAESNVLTNFGNTYIEMNNYDKAKEYYTSALVIKNEINDEKGIAGAYANLGIIAKNLNDTVLAKEYCTKAISIARKIGDKEIEANALSNLALISMLSNNESAETLLLNSLKKSKEVGNPILIMANYKNLREFYEKKGDNTKALEYANMYQALNDSTFKTGNAEKILELQAKYETAEKEKELANLTREKLEQKLKLQQARQYRDTLIGISVFLLVLSALIYSRFIIKKRSQQQLAAINLKLNELNTTKDKIFSIVSHDLKNNVSAFTNITDVMSKNFDGISSQQLKYYVGEMSNSANGMKGLFRNLLEWAKSQRNLITITPVNMDVPSLMTENIAQLQSQLNRKQIQANIKVQEGLHFTTDKDILTTVFRNLLTNAIKYSRVKGVIDIHAVGEENVLKISVTDHGMGMEPEEVKVLLNTGTYVNSKPDAEGEKGAGLGLMLCKELLQKVSGRMQIESTKGAGSAFSIILPLLKENKI